MAPMPLPSSPIQSPSSPEPEIPAPSSPEPEIPAPTEASNKDSWLAKWREKCERALPEVKALFTDESIEAQIKEAFAKACANFLAECVRGELAVTPMYATIWSSLCFAIKTGEGKMKWDTTQGIVAIDLRARIVTAVVEATKLGAGLGLGGGTSLTVDSIIKKRHIQKAKQRKIGKKKRQRKLATRPCSSEAAAVEVAHCLFTKTGEMIVLARQRMGDLFFVELGYIFVPWGGATVVVKGKQYCIGKETLKVVLAKDKESVWDGFIEEAPLMIEGGDAGNDASNEQALKDMIDKVSVCSITIKHEVVVSGNGGKGEKTNTLNFLNLAHKMVMTYTRSDSIGLLKSEKNTLKTLVGMGKILYMLAKKGIDEKLLQERRVMDDSPEARVVCTSLNMFMPRDSRKKRYLETGICLRGKVSE